MNSSWLMHRRTAAALAALVLAAGGVSACSSKQAANAPTERQEFARAACIVNGKPEPIAVEVGTIPAQAPGTVGTQPFASEAALHAAAAAGCAQIHGTLAEAPVTSLTVPESPKPQPKTEKGISGPTGPASVGEPVGAGTPFGAGR